MSNDLWNPLAVLPNVDLTEPIEATQASFLPTSDQRIIELCNSHTGLRKFIDSFSNAFGVSHQPAVLAIQNNVSEKFNTIESLASLRDVLTASVIPFNRARMMNNPNIPRIAFSRSFDFYPWMIGKDYQSLIAFTPGMHAWHCIEKFNGQSSPEVAIRKLSKADIDQPLFTELVKRWQRTYSSRRQMWEDRTLVRSLNMAHHASQLPALIDTRYLDYGRISPYG